MFHANNSLSNTVSIFDLGPESFTELTLLLFLCRAVCVCVCVCVHLHVIFVVFILCFL